MAARNQDFEMWAGDNKWVTFTVEDLSNLTDYTIRWGISRFVGGSKTLLKEVPAHDVTGNIFTVKLIPEDTKELDPRTYYHEAEITSPNGEISTVSVGKMTLHHTIL